MPDLNCPVEEVIARGYGVAGRFFLAARIVAPFSYRANRQPGAVGVMVIARFDEAGGGLRTGLPGTRSVCSAARRDPHAPGACVRGDVFMTAV